MISFMSVIGFSFFGCVGIFLFGLLFYKMVNLCVDDRFRTITTDIYTIERKLDGFRQREKERNLQEMDERLKVLTEKDIRIKFEQDYQNQLRFEYAKAKEKESINKIVTDKLNEIVKPCAIKK